MNDSGVIALVVLSQFHQIAVEPDKIRHQFGEADKPFTSTDILRAAKSLSFRAKLINSTADRLTNEFLPAIGLDKKGNYFIIARVGEPVGGASPKILIQELIPSALKSVTLEELEEMWTGELILLAPRGSLAAIQRVFNLRWFLPSIVKYRKLFGEVIVASLFLQLFALVTPLFFQVVMDKVLVHKGLTTLDVLAFGFFVVAIFDALLSGLRNYTFSHTTNRVDVELGARLFNHLTSLPLPYFESRQVGQTVARVRELDTIRSFITSSSLTLLIDLAFTFIFFGFMWYYSLSLMLIVLATIPFYTVLSVFITPILRHRLEQRFNYGAANHAFLTEAVTGMQTLKSQAVEPQMQRKWEDQMAKYVTTSFRAQNLNNVANQIAGFINKITTLGIIWWGAHLVMANELTVGQLVAFNMMAGRVSQPILRLVQLWQDFQQAGISLKRLGDILNAPREPGYNTNRSTLPQIKGEVRLEHVRFRYRIDGPLVIDDMTLNIRPGEVIGIVGRSGSGKSTLSKLIQRFYVPEAGRVLVDGVDLSIVDMVWLRRNIGVVLQENFLFNRTIRENIALANPGLPMEQVVNAAKLAGAHEFIVELNEGYDTLVGEQGCTLSGGQRQRLAIARALITNPKILIFDEATSALDYESERIIQDNMAAMCQGRSVILIAHRLSTVRTCDRIIVLDKGRIIESGSHDELLALNGYYAKLHSYQSHVPPIKPVVSFQGKSFAKMVKKENIQVPPSDKEASE
jgi:ATP-binding cassette, subfamily B, bacterial HlyB/CyaB